MKNHIKIISLFLPIIFTACNKAEEADPSKSPFGLTCSYVTNHGTAFADRTYIIDPVKHSVDGHSAEFSDTYITWKQDVGSSLNNQMQIERFTGNFTHSWKEGVVATGTCKITKKMI